MTITQPAINNTKPPRPFLTSKEIDEKRAKICFWCDEKFYSMTQMQKEKLFILKIKDIIYEDELEETVVECEDDCVITL